MILHANDRALRFRSLVFYSLSSLWFVIAGLQYSDWGRAEWVLPAALCGVVWHGLGRATEKRRLDAAQE